MAYMTDNDKNPGAARRRYKPLVPGKWFRLQEGRIGARLTTCFALIVLSMVAIDIVAVWQFSRTAASAQQLADADRISLSVIRVRLDVDTFREDLAALADTHNTGQFKTDAASLRTKFAEDIVQGQRLIESSAYARQDPTILSAVETLRTTFPSQIDTAVELASAGNWPAVDQRISKQVQALAHLSSLVVEKIEETLLQQRAEAIESGHRARLQLIVILSAAALFTLLFAVFLGWYATRSITDPLSELEAGARALAKGDFLYRVVPRGEDEVAEVGRVLNYTAQQLATLYETLRRSEARLRLTIDTIPAFVWSTLPDGSVDFSNRRWLEFSGFSLEEARGWGWTGAVHAEDRAPFIEAWKATIALGDALEYEARVRRADGQYRWLLIRQVPLRDETGRVIKWYGTSTDINDRKLAEETLRESETRFRTLVDHMADAMFVYDFERGTLSDVNPEACEGLGYTRQELVGMEGEAFHLDSDQASLESVAQRAAAGETVFDTHWHRRKDGALFPVEACTTLFWFGGRRFLLKVARDITDRKRAEEERERLRLLEADLAHINRVSMMGELAASIAHEINQPLSAIVNNGSACMRLLAGDEPNVEEAREGLDDIVRDGKRAGEIIGRIRALTKRAAPPRERLDLNETIGEVLALVGDEAKKDRVMIRTHFADVACPVLGDRVQLQQVLLNLVMNAIQAMSNVSDRTRQLVITTRHIEQDQLQVTVEDSGLGLEPEKIAKIFEPFYTTKSSGMGMGLSICRSILERHAGRLWATSNDGPGASFHFTLPQYHEEEQDARARRV
jgi:PAS domain S-box-containing protein